MKTEHEYDAMFQALVDIRKNLNEVTSSVYEHIRRAQLECVETLFQEQKDALDACVDGIDQELIKLSVYVEEYQRLRASLKELNEKRIPELGGTPVAMPEAIAGDTLATVLVQRINYLTAQGKL
jgi:ATP phosphoribosyltransferase regulatory subunit HisZ